MLAGIITDMTNWLDRVSSHDWFLLVILVIAFLDSVIPIVPSETCVIIGGVAASLGTQNIFAVITAAAVGAFLGDNAAYLIGYRASDWFGRRAERRPKFAVKLGWAQTQIMQRGGFLLITARFIPGGRTRVDAVVWHHPSEAVVVRALGRTGHRHLGDVRRLARQHRRRGVRE